MAGVGAAGVAGVAGCLDASGAEAGGDAAASRLAYVRVANWHGEPHTVHVLVQRGGDPVHWSSHDLPSGEDTPTTAAVTKSWAADRGAFSVYVRLDDADTWKQFDVSDGGGANCYGVEIRVGADGTLGVWYEQNPDSCDAASATPEN